MSDLTALALEAASEISPSELHGVVCGLAVCPQPEFSLQALVDLVGVEALTDEFRVQAFVSAALEGLLAEDLSFMPLLPDDAETLPDRIEALASWCAGFLSGFGAGVSTTQLGPLQSLPAQVQEIVADIAAISDLDVTQYRDDESVIGADEPEHGSEPRVVAVSTGESSTSADALADSQSESTLDQAESDLLQLQEFVKVGVLLTLSLINDVTEHRAE